MWRGAEVARRPGGALLIVLLCGAGLPRTGAAAPQPRITVPDLFGEGPEGTRNQIVVGLFLAASRDRQHAAAALLAKGTERARKEGRPDPLAEVVLGEVAERLARDKGAPPPGILFVSRLDLATGREVRVYDGAAFRNALEALGEEGRRSRRDLFHRAAAGVLRARYPFPSTGLVALWRETSDWLALVEECQTREGLSPSAARLADSVGRLGRLLLAASRLDDLRDLTARIRKAASRTRRMLPRDRGATTLLASARFLRQIRGDGSPPFPQEAWAGLGPFPAVVRIDGEIGRLTLRVKSGGPAPRDVVAIGAPLLPLPGSLRVARDGSTATWLEVWPSRVVATSMSTRTGEPVLASVAEPLRRPDIRAGSSSR